MDWKLAILLCSTAVVLLALSGEAAPPKERFPSPPRKIKAYKPLCIKGPTKEECERKAEERFKGTLISMERRRLKDLNEWITKMENTGVKTAEWRDHFKDIATEYDELSGKDFPPEEETTPRPARTTTTPPPKKRVPPHPPLHIKQKHLKPLCFKGPTFAECQKKGEETYKKSLEDEELDRLTTLQYWRTGLEHNGYKDEEWREAYPKVAKEFDELTEKFRKKYPPTRG